MDLAWQNLRVEQYENANFILTEVGAGFARNTATTTVNWSGQKNNISTLLKKKRKTNVCILPRKGTRFGLPLRNGGFIMSQIHDILPHVNLTFPNGCFFTVGLAESGALFSFGAEVSVRNFPSLNWLLIGVRLRQCSNPACSR